MSDEIVAVEPLIDQPIREIVGTRGGSFLLLYGEARTTDPLHLMANVSRDGSWSVWGHADGSVSVVEIPANDEAVSEAEDFEIEGVEPPPVGALLTFISILGGIPVVRWRPW